MSMIVKLVRHGESEANVGSADPRVVGDHHVGLTDRGREQARAAGRLIGPDFITGCLLYRSPYLRACQTLEQVLAGAGVEPGTIRVYEDPRLREVDHGYADVRQQQAMRQLHGWF